MDPLEDRIRRGLSSDGWRLSTDDDLLARVHTGAARRRKRRAITGVTAGVLVLSGLAGSGAYIVNDLTTSDTQAAADRSNDTGDTADRDTPGQDGDTMVAPEDDNTVGEESDDARDESEDDTRSEDTTDRVPSGFRPDSLTAIGVDTFWVLGHDPDDQSGRPVAQTRDGGDSFELVGRVPLPAETAPDVDDAAEIRFADQSNGWAYRSDDGLWSTHDGGTSWNRVDDVPDHIHHLEAAGGFAYATVEQDGSYGLWRTPAEEDGWERATTLESPTDLAATQDRVMVPEKTGDDQGRLRVSTDNGDHFEDHDIPCRTDPSPTFDVSATANGLWLTCPTGTEVSLLASTNDGVGWFDIAPDTPVENAVEVGAQDAETLVAANSGSVLVIDSDGTTETRPVDGLEDPVYVGFTTPSVGYVLDGEGGLYRTEDSGQSWSPVRMR